MPITAHSEVVVFRCDHELLIATILAESMSPGTPLIDFQKKVMESLGGAERGLVVDCTRLTLHVSSAFLGVLTRLRLECVQQGKVVCLCGVHGQLQEAIRICCFDRIIPVYANQKEAVKQLGSFSEWEKASIASVDQYESAKRQRREPWNWPKPPLLHRRAGMIATTVALSALVFGGAWVFLSGPPSAERQLLARWRQAKPVQLGGSVRYVDRGVELAGTGNVILAWPATLIPQNKLSFTDQQLLTAEIPATAESPIGPFQARVDASGRFQTEVRVLPGADCDYYVLAVSNHASRRDAIDPSDRAVLALYFSQPEQLLGKHRYGLKRCEVSLGQPSEIDFVLRE